MGLSLNHPHQLRKGYGSDHETSSSSHNNVAANSNGNALSTSPSSVATSSATTGSSTGKSTTLPSSLSSPPGVVNNGSLQPNSSPGVPTQGSATKPGLGRKDDGWKEVTRSCTSSRSKKVIVPSSVISRVIGRGGCNINAIREHTGAHIEVEKQQKGALQPERTIQIKGSADATREAHSLITTLMSEPDADIKKLIARLGPKAPCSSTGSTTGIVIGSTAGTGTNTSGSASSSCAGSTAGRVTPNILNSASAFPVIGSASAPLPPIGQIMSVGSTSSTTSPPTSSLAQVPASSGVTSSSSVPVDIVNNSKGSTYNNRNGGVGPKGSNTNARNNMSTSPPMKNGSPPLKKPTVVNNNSSSTFEIGNFSISEANAEAYNNTKNSTTYTSYGKRTMVFTPSVSNSNQASNNITTNTNSSSSLGHVSSTYSSKHNNQHQHHSSDSHNLDNRDLNWDGSVRQQRTVTPTVNPMVGGKKTPTSIGSSYIAASGSSRSSTPPTATSQSVPATNGSVSHKISGRQQQQQPINNQSNIDRQLPNVLHSMVQNFGSGGGLERNPSKELDSINGPVGDPSGGFTNVARNLAPGSGNSQVSSSAIGSNRGANSSGSERLVFYS